MTQGNAMCLSSDKKIFDKTYSDYLDRISQFDLASKAGALGARMEGDALIIPFFGRPHALSASGLTDDQGRRPDFGACVVLFRCVLMCPETAPPLNGWAAFRDFKSAAPLIGYFTERVENAIAQAFSGKAPALENACADLGADAADTGAGYDICATLRPLPRIPVTLRFNDQDVLFPASCSVLFEDRAASFLDPESLAILGTILAEKLVRRG